MVGVTVMVTPGTGTLTVTVTRGFAGVDGSATTPLLAGGGGLAVKWSTTMAANPNPPVRKAATIVAIPMSTDRGRRSRRCPGAGPIAAPAPPCPPMIEMVDLRQALSQQS